MKAKGGIRSRIVEHGEEDPAQLLANPANFRRHPGEQMNALRGSLKEIGWVRSIIVNRRTGYVVDGHARVEEAIRQGVKSVPVEYVDITPEEEKLALAVLDPITEMATQDDEALAALLADVDTSDPGLRELLKGLEGEPAAGVEVKEVDVSAVEDRFWMSVRGPLPRQVDAIERLRAALEELPAWERDDPPRFVADNRRVLRCVDLQAFNVFDFDAYGGPWDQMTILLARRTWAPGERGAVVLTDGSSLKLRWGGIQHSMAKLAGMESAQGVPTTKGAAELMGLTLAGWVKRAGVTVLRMWQAQGRPPANVLYTAIVFEGVKGAEPEPRPAAAGGRGRKASRRGK